MARRDGIRLITAGELLDYTFPLVVEAVRPCLIDGEVVCCNEHGVTVFSVLDRGGSEVHAFLYAFDLLGLNGTDLRREPIEVARRRSPAIYAKPVTACG